MFLRKDQLLGSDRESPINKGLAVDKKKLNV